MEKGMGSVLLDEYLGEKPLIVYDVHEARSYVVRHLKTFPEITVVKRPLEIADYLVQTPRGTVAVERKRASDFLSSISDGRLSGQIESLTEYPDPRIILEGAIFTSVKDKGCYSVDTLGKVLNPKRSSRTQPRTMWSSRFFIHPHAFISLLEKIQEAGVKLILTGSAHDTAEVLRHWATRGEKRESLTIRQKTKTPTDLEKQIYLLAGLPGISTRRAKALLQEFGTPMKALHAFLEHPSKSFPVEGIGKKTATEIRRLLTTSLQEVEGLAMAEYEFREGVEALEAILDGKERELRGKTVGELKGLLKERGLPRSGRKGDLVERLLEALPEEERIDIPRFLEGYEALLRQKGELHQIPERLQREYRRLKRA
jgi:ERCC4-type nuclease